MQTVRLIGPIQRAYAHRLIDEAALGQVVTIREPTRSTDQNAKMWAMLEDVARSKPDGRTHVKESWKNLFMHALGHEVAFEMGLDNRPFPVGFRTSKLTVRQMADLITFIEAWGSDHGVIWTERDRYEREAA